MGITVENAQDFLQSCRDYEADVSILEDRYGRLRSRAYPGSLRLKNILVQESTPTGDRMADMIADASDLEERLKTHLQCIYKRRQIARDVISEMDDDLHQDILTLYYLYSGVKSEAAGVNSHIRTGLYLLSWADVAYRLNIPKSTCYVKHQSALEEFVQTARDMGIRRFPERFKTHP